LIFTVALIIAPFWLIYVALHVTEPITDFILIMTAPNYIVPEDRQADPTPEIKVHLATI